MKVPASNLPSYKAIMNIKDLKYYNKSLILNRSKVSVAVIYFDIEWHQNIDELKHKVHTYAIIPIKVLYILSSKFTKPNK